MPRRFAAQPGQVLIIDQIARSRGRWVHEVLSLSPEELTYEVIALQQRAASVGQWVRRHGDKATVFPTVDLVDLVGLVEYVG